MKTKKKYLFTDRFIPAPCKTHGWIPQAFLSSKKYMVKRCDILNG